MVPRPPGSGYVPNTYEFTKLSRPGMSLLHHAPVVHRLPSLRDNQESVSPDVPLSYGSSCIIRVGKSVWIYYALRRRLAERKPVIWYRHKKRYLFVEEGVYNVPDDFQEFQVFVWTLVDSDYAEDGVPEDLVMRETRHFVIYCTSPSQKRWSRLHKTVHTKTFIMNPWKRKEISRV